MFCTNCGNNLNTGDNFCGKCGNAVKVSYAPKTDFVEKHKGEYKPLPEMPVEPAPTYQTPISPIQQSKDEKKKAKLRADLKKILEKKSGKEVSESEVNEAESWLRQYADLVWDVAVEKAKRDKKLEQHPNGYEMDGKGYSCAICRNSVSDDKVWYDKYGIKCMNCQKAVNEKVIPPEVAENDEIYYSPYDIESRFCINRFGLRRLIKEGKLKPRVIQGSSGYPSCQFFLIEDNKDTLPPKKLTKSQMVKETKNGEDWFHSEPWFNFADPKKVLKGYKIEDLLKTLKEKEIQKSIGSFSGQLSKGMSTFYEFDYVNKDKPDTTSPPEIKN